VAAVIATARNERLKEAASHCCLELLRSTPKKRQKQHRLVKVIAETLCLPKSAVNLKSGQI